MGKIKSLSWSFWFIGLDLLFVFLTALRPYTPDFVRNSILHHFNLGAENNLANWWSTVNFLLLALLAFEFYSTRIDKNKTAWLILAGIYAFLSLDELGSIHERLDNWSRLLAIAALIGVAYLYVLYRLLPSSETRGLALWIVIGSVLLISVALQEYLEHNILWPSWAKGIRTGVEEGTELLGAYLILRQMISYRQQKGLVADGSISAALPDPFRMSHAPVILLVGLIIHSLASPLVGTLPDLNIRGNPSEWYPSVLFIIIFCAAFWKVSKFSERGTSWLWAGLSALFLIDSILIVYMIFPRPSNSHLYSLGLFSNPYFMFAFQSIFVLLGFTISYGYRALPKIAELIGLAIALLFASRLQGLSTEFIMIGLYACAIAFICFTRMEKPGFLTASVVHK